MRFHLKEEKLDNKATEKKKKSIVARHKRNSHTLSLPTSIHSSNQMSPEKEEVHGAGIISDNRRILLIIAVKLGNSEGRITVHEGDSAACLVSEFAEKHSIYWIYII